MFDPLADLFKEIDNQENITNGKTSDRAIATPKPSIEIIQGQEMHQSAAASSSSHEWRAEGIQHTAPLSPSRPRNPPSSRFRRKHPALEQATSSSSRDGAFSHLPIRGQEN